MKYKITNKLVSGMFLITPLISNAWDKASFTSPNSAKRFYTQKDQQAVDLQVHGKIEVASRVGGVVPSKAIQNSAGVPQTPKDSDKIRVPSLAELKDKATIYINGSANPDERASNAMLTTGNFWFYKLNSIQDPPYVESTTAPDASYCLPGMPMFMSAYPLSSDNFFKYEGEKSDTPQSPGKNGSEVLKPYSDILACIGFVGGDSVIIYRYNPNNRYFFNVAPAAVLDGQLGENKSKEFSVFIDNNGYFSNDTDMDLFGGLKDPPFEYINDYVGKKTTKFYAETVANMGKPDRGARTLSALASQGYYSDALLVRNKRNEGKDGAYSLPGIKLNDLTKNCWITTNVSMGNRKFRTHHVFLNQKWTEDFQNILFGEHPDWPDGLQTCNTTKYGDIASFLGKMQMFSVNDKSPKDEVLFGLKGVVNYIEKILSSGELAKERVERVGTVVDTVKLQPKKSSSSSLSNDSDDSDFSSLKTKEEPKKEEPKKEEPKKEELKKEGSATGSRKSSRSNDSDDFKKVPRFGKKDEPATGSGKSSHSRISRRSSERTELSDNMSSPEVSPVSLSPTGRTLFGLGTNNNTRFNGGNVSDSSKNQEEAPQAPVRRQFDRRKVASPWARRQFDRRKVASPWARRQFDRRKVASPRARRQFGFPVETSPRDRITPIDYYGRWVRKGI